MTVSSVFEQQWLDAAIATPLIETVNSQLDLDSMPSPWASWIVQGETRDDVTMGSSPQVEERGSIVIGLFTRSGNGQADLDTAVQSVIDAFHGFAKDGLQILSVNGPHDIDPSASGEWWRVGLTAEYIYYTVRSAVGPGFGDWQGFPA
jgi:hypothetical protein